MYHATKLWGVCVEGWGSQTAKHKTLVFCLMSHPGCPSLSTNHPTCPAGLLSCIPGASDRSEFPVNLTLRCWGGGRMGHHLPGAFLSQRGCCPAREVGLNTYCSVPVQYWSGRGSSDGSEVIVFPDALVMPPPSYSHRLVYLVEVRGTWCDLPRKTKCLHLVGIRSPANTTLSDPP